MRDFPTLSYTSASKIPIFSYTRTLKRYPSLGRSLPYSSLNTLKKDCLSVRNIGKPQVAFLFTVFFFNLCVYFSPRIGHYRKYPPPPLTRARTFLALTHLKTNVLHGLKPLYNYICFITLQRFTHQEELRNKNININKK